MDADSLTLEQICKDLGISETELDPCMTQTPVQFPTDVLQRRVATTRSLRLPEEYADQINNEGRQTDPRTNKCAKVAK